MQSEKIRELAANKKAEKAGKAAMDIATDSSFEF
jgi:hypothetical protein